MNTFTLVQRALDATQDDPSKVGLDASTIEVGRVLAAVQTVVDALTPPDGGRYVVGFADISTAQTSLGERRITISSKPMRDRSLTLVERAVVLATFAAHEIGHTLVTRPRRDLIERHNEHSGYHAVANLADDIILEPVMVDRFPILADAFVFTGLWVLRNTAKDLPKQVALKRDMTTPERFNVVLSATRYGDVPEIVWDANAVDERDWSRLWADRLCAADLDDHDTFLALCDEAWLRIRSRADLPEPTIEVEPPKQPEPEQGEDEDEQGEDEPGDEQGEDEGEGGESESPDQGEDGDDATEDAESTEAGESIPDVNDQPLDFDDEDEDGESEDESDGTTGSGESMDGADESDDESDDESEGEGDGDVDSRTAETDGDESGGEGEGGGGNPNAEARSEDDFDQQAVEQSMHQQAQRERDWWNDQNLEQQARQFASTTVTSFGKHGSLSTTWE